LSDDHDDEHDDDHDDHEDEGHGGHKKYTPYDQEFYIYMLGALISSTGAGLCSGLTVGLLSIGKKNIYKLKKNYFI
jgi:hypothetical protein